MRRILVAAALAVAACHASGCSSPGPDPPGTADRAAVPHTSPAEEPAPPRRDAQQETARAAQQELFEQLSGRLMAVISDEGLAAAIDVCSRESLDITQRVGQTHGVAIGRTSFRLRNAFNTPPAWAQPLVEQRVEEPHYVDLPDGALGALLPIRLKPTCLACHGTPDQIPTEVQEALAQRYPEDQGTGFAADQLRGWFWIEVPRR